MGISHRIEGTYGKSFRFLEQEGEFTMGVLVAKLTQPDTVINPQTPFGGAPATLPRFGGTISMPLDTGTGTYARLKIGNFAADAAYTYGQWIWGTAVPQNLSQEVAHFNYEMVRANAVYNFDLGANFSGFAAFRHMDYRHTGYRTGPVGPCPVAGTPGSQCYVSTSVGGNREALELQGTYDFLADGRYQLMFGLDGRMGSTKGYAVSKDAATGLRFSADGGYSADNQVFGAYTQFRGKPANWIAINAGIRGDWIWDRGSSVVLPVTNPATYGPKVDNNNSAISPRAAVMLFPTDSTTVFGSYSRAFRAPSTNELHLVSSGVLPASNLKPETVDSGEVGLKQKLGVHRLLASTFVEKRSGLIGFVPASVPGKQIYSGVGDIKNYGFNLGFEGKLDADRFHYGGSFTYAYARRTISPVAYTLSPAAQAAADAAMPESKTKTEILGAPEWSGNLRMAYDFQGNLPEIALAAALLGPRLTGFGYTSVLAVPPASEGAAPTTANVPGQVWRSNIDPLKTDMMVQMRLNVHGIVPYIPALRYSLMANYLFSPAFEPVSYGPTTGGAVPTTAAVNNPYFPQSQGQLFPMPRLTLAAALEVNFD
jgi:outer membrane receptor protein involved in Fe transport